jgi:diguanylate cyclase (GGDEF)-like protein/PAS domain S-box-containing protein
MRYQGSIRKELTRIILIVASLTSLIGYGIFLYWYMSNQHERASDLSKQIGVVLSQDFAKLALLNKVSIGADITTKLKSFDSLHSMVLYKLDATPIYQYHIDDTGFKPKPLPKTIEPVERNNLLELYIPATYQDTPVGYVHLVLVIDSLWDLLQRDSMMFFLIGFSLLFLSYFLAFFFSKKFTEPILYLVTFLEKIEFLDLKKRVVTHAHNEYGKLYEEVNTMLERMHVSQETQKLAALAFETQSGMVITDKNQKILRINRAFTKITGYTQEDVLGQTPALLRSEYQNETFYKEMYANLAKYNHWSGEIYNRHKSGKIYPEHLTIQAVLDEEGEVLYYVASFLDITIQKESEAQLEYLKQYDALTGLVNREMLIKTMREHLGSGEQRDWGALICFDLKDFKLINEAYGHSGGDQLLQEITNRLKHDFSDCDTISRVGSDEFALWFKSSGDTKENASVESKLLIEYLINLFSKPFKIDTKTVHVLPTIGIALYGEKDHDAPLLFKQADSALHMAKREERSFAFFDEQAEETALSHLDMYSQLLIAIEENQFELYYQLQYDHDAQIYSAEALIRWIHPEIGFISPVEFIPIAERTGLILHIGLWVVNEACKQLSIWQQDPTTSAYKLSINVSAKQFNHDDFVEQINDILNRYHVRKNTLKIELTESIVIENVERVREKMQELQNIGIEVSLDDFGTGYSSLQYLKNLPFNQVKIDQSFVKNMLTHENDIAIIKSVLLLGEAFELEVIAEGVETKEHYELLKSMGCRYFQGYYFAKPQKIDTVTTLLRTNQ